MLPSGHIAAGYLVAEAVLRLVKPDLVPGQFEHLLFWGAFFGFVPDIDVFYAFLKERSFILPDKKINHRAYLTHRPLFWLIIALLIYLFAASAFWQMFSLMVWLGTWSHFVLDSFKVGVKWFWPLNNKYFAFSSPGDREQSPKIPLFAYWMRFLDNYPKNNSVTFYLEILILLTAAVVFGSIHLIL